MANTTIKTRILLRNDTLANWESENSVTLGKGEVAIATLNDGLAEVRVGNNTTWANSLRLNISADQVSGLTEMISSLVGDGAKKYQVVANGVDGNSWKLQEAALSGGAWTDVAGSTWTVDFTAINDAISGLTADIDYLSGQITAITSDYATKTELNDVSIALSTDYTGKIKTVDDKVEGILSDYLKAADKTELSNALTALDDAKLAKTDFAALSNDIGLSAASSSNPVVTKDDIKDLAGAMHFRGAVTPTEGETDLEALARVITDPTSGDVAIITTTSKEYVYSGTAWIELGDEILYATKAEVATVSAELTSDIADLTSDVDYLSGQITSITSTYATKDELTGAADALSTDYNAKIDALSDAISGIADDYATKTELNDVSVALSTDYVGKIKTVDDKVEGILSDYLKAADKTELETLVGTTSAETLVSANAYTDTKFAGLSDYYTKNEVNAISTALSTDYVGKIKAVDDKLADYALKTEAAEMSAYAYGEASAYTNSEIAKLSVDRFALSADVDTLVAETSANTISTVVGTNADTSADNTIYGAKAYADDKVNELSSGFLILDCGASTLRDGEPAAPLTTSGT